MSVFNRYSPKNIEEALAHELKDKAENLLRFSHHSPEGFKNQLDSIKQLIAYYEQKKADKA